MNDFRQQPVFRFAPSPNGYLHLGHAYSALLNHDLARQTGGRFLLRIEDIDTIRCKPEFEQAAYEDLAWLGLEWKQPVLRQSEHFSRYAAALDDLRRRGLVYACRCSRKEITAAVLAKESESGKPWPRDPDGAPLYPGTCRSALLTPAIDEPIAWRLRNNPTTSPELGWREHDLPAFEPGAFHRAEDHDWGDVVLGRKETPTSYHLSVVLDDALQGITHVVRGQDLLAATAIHRRLQELLNLPAPLYAHHPLIKGEIGEKLSKNIASKSLRSLRSEGATPEDIRRMIGIPSDAPPVSPT